MKKGRKGRKDGKKERKKQRKKENKEKKTPKNPCQIQPPLSNSIEGFWRLFFSWLLGFESPHHRAFTRSSTPCCPNASLFRRFQLEVEGLICNFYLSVAARKIVCADPSLKYTSMLLGR